jgi:catechol 2,3-dioxygenase-like lactoylglutathione lyase family enzyme
VNTSAKTVSGSPAVPPHPVVGGIVETALIVEHTDRAADFYQELLGLALIVKTERLSVLDAGPKHVLLLFQRGGSLDGVDTPGGRIPGGMDATGRGHMAFGVAAPDLQAWRGWLEKNAIAIESEVRWALGGTSLYFRDLDGNLLELATPGIWPNY